MCQLSNPREALDAQRITYYRKVQLREEEQRIIAE